MKNSQTTFSHHIEYYLTGFLTFLISLLPYSLAMHLTSFLGLIVGHLAPLRRKVVSENLDIAFRGEISKSEKKRLIRESTRSVFLLTVDSVFAGKYSSLWGDRVLTEHIGEHYFSELKQSGKTWINLTAHVGSWEIMATQGKRLDVNSYTVAKPLHNRLIQDKLQKSRAATGINILWTDDKQLTRSLIKVIRSGDQVNFLADQDMKMDGIFVDFFGKPASTTKAPAWLAWKFDLPVLPSFIIRTGLTRHKMVTLPPIYPSDAKGDTDEEKIWWLTQEFTKVIEDVVRQYPAQYFWVHRRWKTTPQAMQKRMETLAWKRHKAILQQQEKPD